MLYCGYSCDVQQRIHVLECLHDLAVIFSGKHGTCSISDNPTITSAPIAYGVGSSIKA